MPQWLSDLCNGSGSVAAYSLSPRLDLWQRDYDGLNWSLGSNKGVDLSLIRIASLVQERVLKAGWSSMAEFVVALDLFRYAFRNGPAHTGVVGRCDLDLARKMALGSFRPAMWLATPIFDKQRSLMSAAGPVSVVGDAPVHGVSGAMDLSVMRDNFRKSFESRSQWLRVMRLSEAGGCGFYAASDVFEGDRARDWSGDKGYAPPDPDIPW